MDSRGRGARSRLLLVFFWRVMRYGLPQSILNELLSAVLINMILLVDVNQEFHISSLILKGKLILHYTLSNELCEIERLRANLDGDLGVSRKVVNNLDLALFDLK